MSYGGQSVCIRSKIYVYPIVRAFGQWFRSVSDQLQYEPHGFLLLAMVGTPYDLGEKSCFNPYSVVLDFGLAWFLTHPMASFLS